MRQKIILLLIALTMVPAFMLTQCKKAPNRELMMLDTLDTIIKRTEENLKFDLITLNNRKSTIEQDQMLMKRFYRDSITSDMGNKMTRYRGIEKIYERFLDGYQIVYNDMMKSKQQALDLRESVVNDQLTKEEFKQYYTEEKELAEENFERSRQISRNIPEIEPDYQRIAAEVEEWLNKVAEKDSVLKGVLDERK